MWEWGLERFLSGLELATPDLNTQKQRFKLKKIRPIRYHHECDEQNSRYDFYLQEYFSKI